MHLLLQAGGSGVTVKLDGSVSIDQATGRLTATFQESPQWPFEDIELTLDGGARAPLANPSTCGTALGAIVSADALQRASTRRTRRASRSS